MSSFGEKIKGFLLNPVETFQAQKGESLGVAYQYYVVLFVIFSALFGIVTVLTDLNFLSATITTLGSIPGMEWTSQLSTFSGFLVSFDVMVVYIIFIIGLFWIFVSGFFVHCFVLMFGGEKGYVQTLKATMYSYTPYLLFGWIPYVNIIVSIWAFVLLALGIRELQELTSGKAVLVVLVPVLLFIIGFILFSIVIVAFINGILGLTEVI